MHSERSELCFNPSPALLTFDYASICRPADEVASNFVLTGSTRTGELFFTIADSASAADPLPALCLRYYLRRRRDFNHESPTAVANGINGLIYDCCSSNCSLTCFYAEYNRATAILRYVNAGHEAPILIRRSPNEVLRLEKGGPVFGLQESPRYSEGILSFRAGDRLITFTQGIIGSLAARANTSAEDLLISLVRGNPNASATQLADTIIAECESIDRDTGLDGSILVASVEKTESPIHATAATEILAAAVGV